MKCLELQVARRCMEPAGSQLSKVQKEMESRLDGFAVQMRTCPTLDLG
eukprot:COSAG02_NODE_58580_length_277_cov_0.567416_1_plen_47_part_10